MVETRRRFLTRVAAAGGASLVYEAMTGLGLLAAPGQAQFELSGRVSNVRVLVLGAGLAGLTTAYELGKVGFDCRVLEARARPGGRVFTVRRGTVSEEDGPGQTAAFDEGLYFNAGPMRISHHHHTTLAYCQELQVPVEVFVADAESAYLYQTRSSTLSGRRIRLREARADFDGYIAELFSKSLSQAQLDQPLLPKIVTGCCRISVASVHSISSGSTAAHRAAAATTSALRRSRCVICWARISISTSASTGTLSPR